MDEYIRKQDAIDAIHCDIKITGRENAETVCKTIESFTDGIKSLEPADVAPVVHARWEKKKDSGLFYCSECGLPSMHKWPYCERCGAKMDGEE